MITASHNPPEYNGIKVFSSDGLAYDMEQESRVETIIDRKHFKSTDWKKVGHDEPAFLDNLYIDDIMKTVKLPGWNVTVDPGCGATYKLAPKLLQAVGCKVAALNAQPDGWFPARSSEPNAESLRNLAEVVKVFNAQAGFGFDGDGDRVAFIDEKGNFADFDQILASYAGYVVKENGGGTVVTSIEASMSLEKVVETSGQLRELLP
jgi:phosphoglucosamine mutase